MALYNVTMTVPYNPRIRPDRGETILRHVPLEDARECINNIGVEELPNGTIVRVTRPTGSSTGSSAIYEEYIIFDGVLIPSYKHHHGRSIEIPQELEGHTNITPDSIEYIKARRLMRREHRIRR